MTGGSSNVENKVGRNETPAGGTTFAIGTKLNNQVERENLKKK